MNQNMHIIIVISIVIIKEDILLEMTGNPQWYGILDSGLPG